MAGKEMPREETKRKISLLSSTIKQGSTREDRDVILEDAEKGQKLHPENFTCVLEKTLQ